MNCDVVVLGGGISGAFAAEALTSVGFNVIVLDKRDVGGGSTSASTALLQYEIDTSLVALTKRYGRGDAERAYRLCHDSINAIERLVSELKVECGITYSIIAAEIIRDALLRRPDTHARLFRFDR